MNLETPPTSNPTVPAKPRKGTHVCLWFGIHKGKPLPEIPVSYLTWLQTGCDQYERLSRGVKSQITLLIRNSTQTNVATNPTPERPKGNYNKRDYSQIESDEAKVFKALTENPGLTIKQLATWLNMPVTHVTCNLRVMDIAGKLARQKGGAGAHRYFVADNDRETKETTLPFDSKSLPPIPPKYVDSKPDNGYSRECLEAALKVNTSAPVALLIREALVNLK